MTFAARSDDDPQFPRAAAGRLEKVQNIRQGDGHCRRVSVASRFIADSTALAPREVFEFRVMLAIASSPLAIRPLGPASVRSSSVAAVVHSTSARESSRGTLAFGRHLASSRSVRVRPARPRLAFRCVAKVSAPKRTGRSSEDGDPLDSGDVRDVPLLDPASNITTFLHAPAPPHLTPFHTVPDLWRSLAICPETANLIALDDPHRSPPTRLTYRQARDDASNLSRCLASHAIRPGHRVGLFAESSARWVVADAAILAVGAADAVRGARAPPEELAYIAEHSACVALVVEDAETLKTVVQTVGENVRQSLRVIIVLHGVCKGAATHAPCPVLEYEDAVARGAALREERDDDAADAEPRDARRSEPSDLATVVYTSGTTGRPKGVLLTHDNLISQVRALGGVSAPSPGNTALSMLPPWHAYERAATYYFLSRGVTIRYTNVVKLRDDLAVTRPDYLATVPLVLSTLRDRVLGALRSLPRVKSAVALFLLAAATTRARRLRVARGVDVRHAKKPPNAFDALLARVLVVLTWPLVFFARLAVFPKIREALGVGRGVVSGGGPLPGHVDDFYEAVGVEVSNGWGLTESSPVITARPLEVDVGDTRANVRGSVGFPIPGVEVAVVHPETRRPMPDGEVGVLLARSPGVCAGYLDDPRATIAAIDKSGWLDTGDLGWIAPANVRGSKMAGAVVLVGRAKDTVVLSSGENVEPAPLEDYAALSPLVRQVMIVGNGERCLGALVVPDAEAARAAGLAVGEELRRVVAEDVARRLAERPGARAEEKIRASRVAVLPTDQIWDVESGCMTRTFKLRRGVVAKRHAWEIDALFRGR